MKTIVSNLSVDELEAGVAAGDRAILARAISLIESTNPGHAAKGDMLLNRLLGRTGAAVRVGITGVPGAGKSTFIESLGVTLCARGRRVAVLAIDPSSTISGGSILGDRTRMTRLARDERAFIRPSPSGGTLGGVARRTREAGLLCEAAGFDVILIETVGVGQSELLVADMVDCVVTLALAGAGDELQGVKRGILEVVDVIAVNKADGDNVAHASIAARELQMAVRVLRGGGETPPVAVTTCSGATGDGVAEVWRLIEAHVSAARERGEFDARRREQRVRWLRTLVHERVQMLVDASPGASAALERAQSAVRDGALTPGAGAHSVIEALVQDLRGGG